MFNIRDSNGLKLLTPLRLFLTFLSHRREHKFNHNFENTLNPLCSCSLETDSVNHFFLRCHNFVQIRTNLKNELQRIDRKILELPNDSLIKLLLYGDDRYNTENNTMILNSSIKFIIESNRFDELIL